MIEHIEKRFSFTTFKSIQLNLITGATQPSTDVQQPCIELIKSDVSRFFLTLLDFTKWRETLGSWFYCATVLIRPCELSKTHMWSPHHGEDWQQLNGAYWKSPPTGKTTRGQRRSDQCEDNHFLELTGPKEAPESQRKDPCSGPCFLISARVCDG